jgi:hypothetical protein
MEAEAKQKEEIKQAEIAKKKAEAKASTAKDGELSFGSSMGPYICGFRSTPYFFFCSVAKSIFRLVNDSVQRGSIKPRMCVVVSVLFFTINLSFSS